MKRLVFIIVFIVMVIVISPFLINLKGKELCPAGYSFVDGVCCADKDKNRLCDEEIKKSPVLEEPAEVNEPEAALIMESQKHVVEIRDLHFYPEVINITVGDTIIWANREDLTPHIVYEPHNLFRSPRLSPGDKYEFLFNTTGEYLYSDSIFAKTMRGKIIVKERPELEITGKIVKFISKTPQKIVSSILLIFILVLINIVIYKKERRSV